MRPTPTAAIAAAMAATADPWPTSIALDTVAEPESLAGVALAGREHLDNLIFVVNCNLQRLDGPVRGNAKIIQELEGLFRGAGWNVIKLLWAREWDPLLAADTNGVLVDKMNATVDGEFQKYRVENGAYIREHFFGPDPRLRSSSPTSPTMSSAGCAGAVTTRPRSTPRTPPRATIAAHRP